MINVLDSTRTGAHHRADLQRAHENNILSRNVKQTTNVSATLVFFNVLPIVIGIHTHTTNAMPRKGNAKGENATREKVL